MAQNHSSKDTSVNKNKMPAVYSKVDIPAGTRLLDYGCGRYYEFTQSNLWGVRYIPYDPYWCSWTQNNRAFAEALRGRVDMIVCSNVLNVLDSEEAVENTLLTLAIFAHRNRCPVFITVYEGDGKGKGRVTKEDCWQRNEKLHHYLAYMPRSEDVGEDAFVVANVERGMIVLTA